MTFRMGRVKICGVENQTNHVTGLCFLGASTSTGKWTLEDQVSSWDGWTWWGVRGSCAINHTGLSPSNKGKGQRYHRETWLTSHRLSALQKEFPAAVAIAAGTTSTTSILQEMNTGFFHWGGFASMHASCKQFFLFPFPRVLNCLRAVIKIDHVLL